MSDTFTSNYKILSLLGTGGMSEVYLAENIKTGAKVAIKILDRKLSKDSKFRERFKREVEISKKLSHPNIVKILSWGFHKDNFYIVYEYIEGVTLDKYMKSKKFNISEVEKIILDILKGLSYAHKENIIHRDIKPTNIMISFDCVKILDFGIAKAITSHTITQTGIFMGSPAYSSPEQSEGKKVDSRSDVYSLGVVLFEILSGKLPFNSDTPWGLVHQHIYDEPPDILKLNKSVPQYLVNIVSKCLSKNPSDRFNSIDEIATIIDSNKQGTATIIKPIGKMQGREKRGLSDWAKIGIVFVSILIIIATIISIISIKANTNGSGLPDIATETVTEEGVSAADTEATIKENNKIAVEEAAPKEEELAIEETTSEEEVVKSESIKDNSNIKTSETKDYSNMNAEVAFLDEVYSLIDKYKSALNHMNTYHKEGWIFNDPSEIALEETFLVKLTELSNELKEFSYPSSYTTHRSNLVAISVELCNYESSIISCMKNDDYNGCVNNYNLFWTSVDKLFDYYNSIVDEYNRKYN